MRTKFRRAAVRLLAAALCLGLLIPPPARAAEVYFTSLNDSLLQLTPETMPFWSGGGLYVPYTVFDSRDTGIDLGLNCAYERDKSTVSIFNIRSILSFDLTTGNCWDDKTRKPLSGRVVTRNGRIYVSLSTVCSFFGLDYSYTALSSVSQGYLVRIKSGAVVLSDAKFIDAAGDLIRQRLREYNQGAAPEPAAPSPAPAPGPGEGTEEPSSSIPTYLAFRCESGEEIPAILDVLDTAGIRGLFFLTPEALEGSDLVRRLLGSGHSVGVLARGEEPDQVRAQLEEGAALLEGTVHLRSTLADVPRGTRQEFRAGGWVCWEETLSLSPEPGVGPAAFAAGVLRRLSGRPERVCLTLEADEEAVRVLPALLRRLTGEDFVAGVPLETLISSDHTE